MEPVELCAELRHGSRARAEGQSRQHDACAEHSRGISVPLGGHRLGSDHVCRQPPRVELDPEPRAEGAIDEHVLAARDLDGDCARAGRHELRGEVVGAAASTAPGETGDEPRHHS